MDQVLCTSCQARIPSQDAKPSHSIGPRIDELLACNEAPLESEADLINSYLTGAESRLRYVEDSITRLKRSLASLEGEQKTLKDHIAKGRNVLHPIRRMPLEMLEKVFRICVEGEIDEIDKRSTICVSSSLDMKRRNWVLGHVSRRWRCIILSSPQFWTNIRLELHDCTSPISWRTFLLGLYISRSQGFPLYVNLYAALEPNYSNSFQIVRHHAAVDCAHSFLNALYPTVPRWHSLFLAGMTPTVIENHFSSLKSCLSSLQALSIIVDGQNNGPLTQFNIFQDAPNLHDLVLGKLPFNALFYVPFQQVTALELDFLTEGLELSRLLECLGQTNQLGKLVLKSLSLTATGGFHNVNVLTLPLVRHFVLWPVYLSRDSITAEQLLETLLLPGLVVLQASGTSPGSVQSLITRSRCHTLQELILYTKISEGDFILLASNSSLVAIHFTDVQSLTDVAVAELTIRNNSNPCLPKLESIRLIGNLSFDAAKFVHMIESRWKASGNGGQIVRPRMIELGRTHGSQQSKPTNLSALDRFNDSDHFRGIEWKTNY